MWAAMKIQKRRRRDAGSEPEPAAKSAAGLSAAKSPAKPAKPFDVILGWGGSGKSVRGFRHAAKYKRVGFLGLTAALLDSVPEEMQSRLAFKMTVAAFVARPQLDLQKDMCLYIDEISMVPPLLLDEVLRRARACAVICTGDVYQIPPILPDNAEKRWFFEADEYARRNPKVVVVEEQHRLAGKECADVRALLEAVAYQHRASMPKNAWKEAMATFVERRRLPQAPPGATIIVFTNDQIKALTRKWAAEHKLTLDRHGLCKGMPVSITANAFKVATAEKVEYAYRNGQRGVLEAINETSVAVRLDATGKNVTVQNGGAGKIVPMVKSAIAQTVDAAQGKTIKEHVHVIVPKRYTPEPARLLVAFSRAKSTSVQINDAAVFAQGCQEAQFDKRAVLYAANYTL